MIKTILLIPILSTALLLTACGEKNKEEKASLTESGMKCGAGKCGASMVDGNTVLAKKKKNILKQMRENDSRKDCVLKATTSKVLYDCVRDPKTNRLTTKCGKDQSNKSKEEITMKCGAGKCSSGMSKPKVPPVKAKAAEPEAAMKCAAGKCSSSP